MKEKKNEIKYALAVLASGCLWGTMGYFRRHLGEMGIDTFGVVFVRCIFAAILYALFALIRNPSVLKIRLKDAWCFLGSGIVSLLFFSACYFKAMTYMSLSAAAILLYTAPCFVMLMSALLFKEKITYKKLFAMIMAFLGCCFVSGIGKGESLSATGLLFGLGSGFGYALYSIFGHYAIGKNYSSLTISFWSCLLAGIGAAIICAFTNCLRQCIQITFSSAGNTLFCITAAFITTFLPYLLYTFGLTGIEAGAASVIASIEPVVATIVGIFLYNERLSLFSIIGIALVILAIFLLAGNTKEKTARKKTIADEIPFDPEKQIPVIKCSICTGEQIAGFKNIKDGHFTEVMMLKSNNDLNYFKEIYQINDIKKEY